MTVSAATQRGTGSTVSIELVKQSLQVAHRQGFYLQPLLERCGLPADILQQESGQRLPVARFAEFWRQLADFLQDEFCLMDHRAMRPGSFAFMCRIAARQPTVAEGIAAGLEFLSLVFDDMHAVLRREQNLAQIVFLESEPQPKRAFAYFTFWMYVHGLTCWLANQRIPILAIDSRCPPPELDQDYRVMFTHSLRYNCQQSRLLFVCDSLDSPIRRSEQELQRFIADSPDNIMVKYRDPHSLTSQVRHLLGSIPPAEWPDAPAMAQQLCMSVATLRRRLSEEGQSFQAIKDSVRKARALQLLASEHQTFVDIAATLGFADVSSFYKAFRKWTGIQPGFYRSTVLNQNS